MRPAWLVRYAFMTANFFGGRKGSFMDEFNSENTGASADNVQQNDNTQGMEYQDNTNSNTSGSPAENPADNADVQNNTQSVNVENNTDSTAPAPDIIDTLENVEIKQEKDPFAEEDFSDVYHQPNYRQNYNMNMGMPMYGQGYGNAPAGMMYSQNYSQNYGSSSYPQNRYIPNGYVPNGGYMPNNNIPNGAPQSGYVQGNPQAVGYFPNNGAGAPMGGNVPSAGYAPTSGSAPTSRSVPTGENTPLGGYTPDGGYNPNYRPDSGSYGYVPQNGGYAQNVQPQYSAGGAGGLNTPPEKKKKMSNKGIFLLIAIIAVLFVAVILVLILTSTGDETLDSNSVSHTEQSDSDRGTTTVEIQIQPKPALESEYYQDEETGLLTTTGVAKRVSPSVVDVVIYKDTTLYAYSQGSGIIISDDGYIVTNAHVVADANAGVKVILDDDSEYEAEVIGQDSKTDIAVLKINADGLTPADLGDSDQLELGEMVVAIGNAGGYSGTLTVGYVSGLDREVKVGSGADTMICIQTDAAMSPGVSGGALINMYGQVVGITSSKYKSSDLDEGIGFAITTQFAKPIIEDIISQGYISGRVRVGITYNPIDSAAAEVYGVHTGIYVQSISDECDISNTELQVGDVITSFNGKDIYSAETIKAALDGLKPGDKVTAHVYRQGITEGDVTEFDIEFELMQDTNLG